jgi:hypothetical protein
VCSSSYGETTHRSAPTGCGPRTLRLKATRKKREEEEVGEEARGAHLSLPSPPVPEAASRPGWRTDGGESGGRRLERSARQQRSRGGRGVGAVGRRCKGE